MIFAQGVWKIQLPKDAKDAKAIFANFVGVNTTFVTNCLGGSAENAIISPILKNMTILSISTHTENAPSVDCTC